MRYTVVITDAAAADIDDQLAYLQRVTAGTEVGQRWLLDLYESINALEEFVGYARARESELLGADLRQKIFRTHRIVFSVDENARVVTVHFVMHGRRRTIGEQEDPG